MDFIVKGDGDDAAAAIERRRRAGFLAREVKRTIESRFWTGQGTEQNRVKSGDEFVESGAGYEVPVLSSNTVS
jgi:hypothetical protein